MALQDDMLARMRLELGDQGTTFVTTANGDGSITKFDVPVGRINDTTLVVRVVHNNGTNTLLTQGPDYTMDDSNEVLTTTVAPLVTDILQITGTSYDLFLDAELMQFLNDAMAQHNYGRTIASRTLNTQTGFIQYTYTAVDFTNLPPVEEYPVVLLAVIEALWTLATDASMDVNIATADGTNVDRSSRYSQLMRQIDSLQQRYDWFREQLNVGLGRLEIFNLRRVSRTTNRLVPLYVEREYDDNSFPKRILPPIDASYEDPNAGLYPDYGYWGGNW